MRDPAIWYNADLGVRISPLEIDSCLTRIQKYFVFATREGIKIYTAPSLKGYPMTTSSYLSQLTSRSQTLDAHRLRAP